MLHQESPLWMVTQEPTVNQFITNLQALRLKLEQSQARHQLAFYRHELEAVRSAFARLILNGEERLHGLCQLLCDSFVTNYQIQSVVIGEVATSKERFTLSQTISAKDLYTTTDIDLGHRQLKKLQFWDGTDWSKANLIANVVDYQPTYSNPYNIHRLTSRIKAEEEIWNKVVDEMFNLDSLVARDKKLRRYSRYVKDIFGLKIVVGLPKHAYDVQNSLEQLVWTDSMLTKYQIKPGLSTRQISIIELKDYLSGTDQKQSGWSALKSVVRWADKMFEIQIQPLNNFLHERELLTTESHTSFKARREELRDQVAQQLPLFGFFRDLLRWLFLSPTAPPPNYPSVEIILID